MLDDFQASLPFKFKSQAQCVLRSGKFSFRLCFVRVCLLHIPFLLIFDQRQITFFCDVTGKKKNSESIDGHGLKGKKSLIKSTREDLQSERQRKREEKKKKWVDFCAAAQRMTRLLYSCFVPA